MISHIIDIIMGLLRMWTGSDSLKVSSQQERKSKPISHNARDFFFKQFFIQFILFLAFVHGDPDDLMV